MAVGSDPVYFFTKDALEVFFSSRGSRPLSKLFEKVHGLRVDEIAGGNQSVTGMIDIIVEEKFILKRIKLEKNRFTFWCLLGMRSKFCAIHILIWGFEPTRDSAAQKIQKAHHTKECQRGANPP